MSVRALLLLASAVCAQATSACYWNAECPFQLHSTKTPYDTHRGDIRDHAVPQNCEAVSIWTLNRHGNRNPNNKETRDIKYIASLKDEIVASYDAGRSQLCAQDADNFRKWVWNSSIEVSQSFLTATGYGEIFDFAKRLRQKYSHLLKGSDDDYYVRPANNQRVITSAKAFVHGLTEGTNLNITVKEFRTYDDVTAVQKAVQQRLGITTQLTPGNVFAIYELCRFDRSWNKVHKSPWCAVFSQHDLMVLEYKDDIRHYYKNGYGSWVNVKLGGATLKDLYESFKASVNGRGKKITSYFIRGTMLEMVFCAMGIFKDAEQLKATNINPNRLWRTSNMGSFNTNLVVELNRCKESGDYSHRVQFFVNEKKIELCSQEGCTWRQFQDKFQVFQSVDLDFCRMENKHPEFQYNNTRW